MSDKNNFSGLIFYKTKGIEFSKTEKQLISENIKRILGTRKGERVNNPYFGSDLQMLLFSPETSVQDIVDEIKNSVEANEPRVKVLGCTFDKFEDEILYISLQVEIINSNEVLELEVRV